jgi:sporulation protein Cse60
MFAEAWENELNNFISNETIRVIDIKFSVAAMDEPIGSDLALYSALVLYEEK